MLRLTAGRGVDCVVEVGGAGTLARSCRRSRGGKVCLIGFLAGREGDTSPFPLMMDGGSLHGIFVGDRRDVRGDEPGDRVNRIKPVIDRVFPFDDARPHSSPPRVGRVRRQGGRHQAVRPRSRMKRSEAWTRIDVSSS